MIKIHVDNEKRRIDVDHNYLDQNYDENKENQLVLELLYAIDILCADLYVRNSQLNNIQKETKAFSTRNRILDKMKKIDYSCPEYFED